MRKPLAFGPKSFSVPVTPPWSTLCQELQHSLPRLLVSAKNLEFPDPRALELRNSRMSVEQFVLLRVDNREVCGISPCVNNVEQAIVTVQSQGVYLYNVRVGL